MRGISKKLFYKCLFAWWKYLQICIFHTDDHSKIYLTKSAKWPFLIKKFSGCCTKVTYILFFAASKAGDDKLFVHINTTTFVVNYIHTGTSRGNLRHGTLSFIILLYVLLPKRWTGQVVVQMRVPEISLVNGLHAQNKHDLCRTISIQNDIDKLNTFQLTQFHLWWCQVCRAWEFS